jgi:transcriptional regulator with XRE-family HTH domain
MEKDRMKMARALRDFVLGASEEELKADLKENGEDFEALASHGRAVVERAMKAAAAENSAVVIDLRKGLGALIQMLRRRARLSPDDLAGAASVDVAELRAIESNPEWEPHPRTIYQLANFFKISPRSLVVLSGAKTVEAGIREEALRFAASSKAVNKLSREEKKLLSEFVKYLGEQTDQ